ncbi:methyl-accepting chemotaxis protein [Acidocella aminolytica]|uniref:methyl-accepting chemotaxis protein n=1 Tax=Acidocella aminolytica TaxID=33998 RepID=UPI00069BFAC2|nr:methyl-accepting chemotaxis protein [Acidocella aminolytica]GBQ44530.1 methyl-accepting chemotaxis protein [Acidocella aminolytica 101 = DSM 11237]SHE92030.1 methyl-accepting chemotaxis protein [Acidocella aminolytica 101 = DSM 11237]
MRNQPIFIKILTLLGGVGLISVAVTIFMAIQLNDAISNSKKLQHTVLQAAANVENAYAAERELVSGLYGTFVSQLGDQNQIAEADIQTARKEITYNLTQASPLAPDFSTRINDLLNRTQKLISVDCAKSITLAKNATSLAGNFAAQSEFINSCQPNIPKISENFTALRESLVAFAAKKQMAVNEAGRRVAKFSSILSVLALALGLAGAFFAVKFWISTPLNRLRSVVERLAGGELTLTVPDADRKDEIGQIARTLQIFKDAGIEKQRIEQAAKRAEAETEADRVRNESAREAAAAVQARVVESLADGLERLSSGDLMFRINHEFTAEYEKLRADFNRAMDVLQQTMRQISSNAEGVRSSAGEITQSADDLSRRTEQQAASLEQTAAALDEVTATVRKASEGANEARGLANEAKGDAERSGAVVTETVTAMGEIESSSKKIANIIGVIDEIAFQTNLLALNAGVEAARAGDAGRGFAVVATEVRALAQRSADAAKEIKTLIGASGVQVQSGVRLVNETGQSLNRIVEQVTRLSVLISDIAGSAQEQATALAEVNGAVNQMDQVTQQNAAMVEESTAASHALATEAGELARLVGQFRIGENRKSARSVVPRQTKAVARLANKVPAVKTLVPVAASGDDWDEF